MSSDAGAGSIASLIASLLGNRHVQQFGAQVTPVGGRAASIAKNYLGPVQQNGGLGASLGSIFGGIADTLNPQQDPLSQLYQSLVSQLQAPVAQPGPINTADIMKQVQGAINPIYDARENVARGQAGRAQADVKSLYGDLAKNYADLAPQQVAQSKDAQKQVADLYGQLRSNVEGNYSRVSKEQGDEFKQLGIEAALPDVLGKQQAAVTDATTAAAQNQAAEQQRYMDIGQMDANYYREGSPNSIMRGNEESTNLLNQLQDYIQQSEGERASGIQTGYLQQLGQAQSAQAQQQQAATAQTNQHQQMLWQILQSQLQGQQNQKVTPDSFLGGLPQGTQQSVAQAFTSLQRSPEAIYGKVEDPRNPVPGSFVSTTPQWYEAQADKLLQSGQIDQATHQALLEYLQLYFGSGGGGGGQ